MISVNFTSDVENIVATEHLYQWDNGQKLSISGVGTNADIHFANKKSEKALVVTPTVTSGTMVAFIPNSLLAEPYPILAYVYVPSDDGARTLKTVTIAVEARKQPSDFVLDEDEGVTTLESISQRVNEMIQSATNQINTAVSNMQTDYGNFKTTIQSELADMVANTTIPNADTLDGLHANEFYKIAPVQYGDANKCTKPGIYYCTPNAINNPVSHYGLLKCYTLEGNTLWIEQQFTSFEGGAGSYAGTWIRIYINSGWSNWIKINDGGNADTLDGKHASDLFQKSEGLRSGNMYSDIFSTTLTSDHACWNKHCFVVGQSTNPDSSDYIDNAPEIKSALWYEVFTCGVHNRSYQIAFGCYKHQRKTFIRYKHDEPWSSWYNVADGGNATTANTAGTLATTPTNVCLRNISFGTANPQVTDSSAEGYVAEGALYGQYA